MRPGSSRLSVMAGMLSLVLFAPATPANGHDVWLEPSVFRASPGDTLLMDVRVGEGFRGRALTRQPARIDAFWISGEGVFEPVRGVAGVAPAGALRIPDNARGLLAVHYRTEVAAIALSSDSFARHLIAEGLDHIVESPIPAATVVREAYSRCVSTLLIVHSAEVAFPSRPDCALTLWPTADSPELTSGSELLLDLRMEGRPVEGALVVAIHREDPTVRVERRSDRYGTASIPLDRAGAWLVKSVHMRREQTGRADWRSWWASLTFQVESH